MNEQARPLTGSDLEHARRRQADPLVQVSQTETLLLQEVDRLRAENTAQAAKLADAEAGLAKAREENGRTCYEMVFWWGGEYEGECELPKYHAGPHFDGLSWWNDAREEVDPPAALGLVQDREGQANGSA